MLNPDLWTSFEKELSAADVERIEDRLVFLKEILEDAVIQYHVEDVSSELDLNLHVYLNYFDACSNTKLTAWLIHDSWFHYYSDGVGLNPELLEILSLAFLSSELDLYSQLKTFLNCLNSGHLIFKEADAVVWLSFLDYMASKLIFHIGNKRMQKLFIGASEGGISKI
ncbi:hypothetical protein [Simplicispira lacusdiani]|uniref:hypothetical protein n=1 Tax=Simplicispira lacusdiani TaxID=2213010 RepID=UPI0013009772|nr:hypothetical protein [Simplicispira lacusdiani]